MYILIDYLAMALSCSHDSILMLMSKIFLFLFPSYELRSETAADSTGWRWGVVRAKPLPKRTAKSALPRIEGTTWTIPRNLGPGKDTKEEAGVCACGGGWVDHGSMIKRLKSLG